MEIINGNLLTTPVYYKIHQVNCQLVMGAGIALAIKNKYPNVYNEYKKIKNPKLGDVQFVHTTDCCIINQFSQDRCDRNGRFTNYEAFYTCLDKIKTTILNDNSHPKTLGLPYNIGCGIGGGDWNIIYAIINSVFNNCEIDVKIVKLHISDQ